MRIDSHAYQGYHIQPHYDSLVAKIICWGNTREESISRMKRALNEFVIDGISTTITFHLKVLDNAEFKAGNVTTNFIEKHFSKAKA